MRLNKFKSTIILALSLWFFNSIAIAAGPAGEVVSLKCGYAIGAAVKKMEQQVNNIMIQEALNKVDENNDEFICVKPDDKRIYIRLQSKEMSAKDSKLLFTIDAHSYEVMKTHYGR